MRGRREHTLIKIIAPRICDNVPAVVLKVSPRMLSIVSVSDMKGKVDHLEPRRAIISSPFEKRFMILPRCCIHDVKLRIQITTDWFTVVSKKDMGACMMRSIAIYVQYINIAKPRKTALLTRWRRVDEKYVNRANELPRRKKPTAWAKPSPA